MASARRISTNAFASLRAPLARWVRRLSDDATLTIAVAAACLPGAALVAPSAHAGQRQTSELSVVYVSRVMQGQVAVIDVQTDALIRVIPTGTNPAQIGVVEALNAAFVADLSNATMTVIDTTTHRVDEVFGISSAAATVAVDETAQLICALDYSNGEPGTDLHVIDAPTRQEINTFTVGGRTQNICVASGLAYLTDFVDGVVVVDTTTGAVVDSLAMADLAHGIALDETTGLLYVTRLDSDSVAVIDSATLTVSEVLAVGSVPQWVALDGPRNKAFVSNEGDGTVSVIDTITNTVKLGAITVGDGPLTVTVHEGAARAYVLNLGDGSISIIDTVNETVVATLDMLFGDGFESGDTSSWTATVD